MALVSRLAPLLGFVACSSAPSGTLKIVTGGETDVFSRPSALVTKLEIDSVDSSGQRKTLATASLPTSSIDLGSFATNTAGTLQVVGTGTEGARLVYGQSLSMTFGALDGLTVPIFVQRTGELARMPRPLGDARPAPTLALLTTRYLFIGGGSDSALEQTTQLYDFASLSPLAAPPSLPRVPKSVAFVGTVGWLIDESGATSFDFSANTSSTVTAPAGGGFGDIAGGSTVFASDGSQYVIGATRTTGVATATVLAVDANGKPSWKFLAAPRLGAAAAWVDGRGLVIAGGSTSAGGVEVLGIGSTTGSELAYPADTSKGAGASTLDAQHVLLAGGLTKTGQDAGVRTIDLGCAAQCTPTPWAALPTALAPTQAFASDPTNALVIGSDIAGVTRVYRVTPTMATEVATKVPHKQARALISPLGSVVLFGGAGEIESFVP